MTRELPKNLETDKGHCDLLPREEFREFCCNNEKEMGAWRVCDSWHSELKVE